MLKAAIEKIQEMVKPEVMTIEGRAFAEAVPYFPRGGTTCIPISYPYQ